jgi:hypothetical protein
MAVKNEDFESEYRDDLVYLRILQYEEEKAMWEAFHKAETEEARKEAKIVILINQPVKEDETLPF